MIQSNCSKDSVRVTGHEMTALGRRGGRAGRRAVHQRRQGKGDEAGVRLVHEDKRQLVTSVLTEWAARSPDAHGSSKGQIAERRVGCEETMWWDTTPRATNVPAAPELFRKGHWTSSLASQDETMAGVMGCPF